MKIAYAVTSTVLHRTVFIGDKAAATKFAETQSEHTGVTHTAEPVEIHDDATKLDALIDEANRSTAVSGMSLGARRALGLELPAPAAPAKPADAPAADEEKDAVHA